MNKEEIDKWLDNEYGTSYTRLEELHDFLCKQNMKFQDKIEQLQQELNQKNKIIEEIKESCRSVVGNPEYTIVSKNKLMKILLKKIEELEKGNINEME